MRANNSYIYRQGTTPNTKSAISSKVKIYSYAYNLGQWTQIGVISSFNPSQSRNADAVRGIGYGDQIAEVVPGVQDPITISVERTCLYLANMFQVFGYRGGSDGLVRALKHHRWPFDIRQEMVISELERANLEDASGQRPAVDGKNQALFTIYEGCWMTSYNYTVSSDTSMISESTDITCTDIVDGRSQYNEFIASGGNPVQVPQGTAGGLNGSRLFAGGAGNVVA